MPDNNPDKIEAQLQSLAESDDLVKWLSDVDLSKYVIDWLEDEGFSGWKVKLAVKVVSLLVVNAGKYGGSAISEIARERFVGFLKKSEKVKAVLEKLEDLRKMTNQQIAAQEGLKELLKGNIDRASGNIEHRESLSLDIQAHLEELDRLHDIGSELEALKAQLSEQPEFVNPNTTGTEINKFVYRSQYIPFAGREKEIEFLESFLKSERMFSWQAIIGPGGVGKSRLGLEFCLQHGVGFRSGVLDDFDFNFKKWQPCQPTLLVVDYTSKERDKLQNIIKFLTNRETKHECKIRLLILDRDSSDHQLNSLSEHRHTRDSRFKEPYLLKQPDPAIAKSIFEFFFEKEDQAIPASWDELLKRLESIDADMRPLFAAYLGSAVAKGEGDRHFNRESLLQDVIRREIEDIMEPCGVTEKDLALLALATMIGGISTENNFTLPECVTPLQELIHAKNRFKALNCMVVEDPETSQKIQVIPPWEPDLVGELFVLDFLKDDVDTGVNRYRRDILNAAWDGDSFSTAAFLDRCRQDYFDHAGFSDLVVQPDQLNKRSAVLWATFVANLIASYGGAEQFGRAKELYADLERSFSLPDATPEIILQHANAAFNMICYCSENDRLDKAEDLYADLARFSSLPAATPEIVLVHAYAAVNLISDYGKVGNLGRTEVIYSDLATLSSLAEASSEIVLCYAQGACNMMISYCFQQEDSQLKVQELYEDLKELYSTRATPGIEIPYIKGTAVMVLFAHKENDHKSANQYLSEFRNMCKKYPDNPELLELSGLVESILEKSKATS